jgi:hypothetical protein
MVVAVGALVQGAVRAAVEAAEVDEAVEVAVAVVGTGVVEGVRVAVLVEAGVVADLLGRAEDPRVVVVAVFAAATGPAVAIAVGVAAVGALVELAAGVGLDAHRRLGAGRHAGHAAALVRQSVARQATLLTVAVVLVPTDRVAVADVDHGPAVRLHHRPRVTPTIDRAVAGHRRDR